jgi:hypothetical protein
MTHLPFSEIRRCATLLQVAYPTVTERVHSAQFDFETLANWIESVSEHIMVG